MRLNNNSMCYLRKVLIVDDDNYNLALIGNMLKNLGIAYDTAADGTIAKEILIHNKYDLLLLDLQMPIVSGIDVASFLKKQHSENTYIPIILCTTLKLDDVYVHSLKNDLIEDYLFKPFDEMILLESIQNVFDKKQLIYHEG